jgi:hypothetical protein
MKILAPWPFNRFGTPWRRALMYFDWQDEEILSEAILEIDPLKITVRCRPVAAIGFESVAEMVMYRLAEPIPYGPHWDQERMCIIIDPCPDPDAMAALVEEQMDTIRFSIFGVAVVDLADEATYRQLSAALGERQVRFVGETPLIAFSDV